MSKISTIERSSGELSKGVPFTVEDMSPRDADPEKIGTTADHQDMVRMGKVQQFKVEIIPTGIYTTSIILTFAAEFSLPVNSWIHLHLVEYLGRSIDVRYSVISSAQIYKLTAITEQVHLA
jgi:hypothetical protein